MAAKEKQSAVSQVASVVHIPGYQIKNVLGRGGMATVYLAIQQSIGREVALKVLAPDHSDPSFSERFLREARIVSRLAHPNIITVYDAGVHQSCHYMAMEYIPGKDLQQVRERLTLTQRLNCIKQVAEALVYAHGKGYVHRDIKPENIMIHEDGRAVLTDFGIARGQDVTPGLTQTGKAIGTPYYMSPEQTKGINVDHRTDIYSLGVVLFQALTGHVPYDGPSVVAIGIKHISEPIPELPKALARLQPIVLKCMSKDPAHRYQQAGQLLQDLLAIPQSELDYIEARSRSALKSDTHHHAHTIVETLNTPATPSGAPVSPQPKRRTNTDPVDVTNSDDYRKLRRRRRMLLLLMLLVVAGAGYYKRSAVLALWQTQGQPRLAQFPGAEGDHRSAPKPAQADTEQDLYGGEHATPTVSSPDEQQEEITLVRIRALRHDLDQQPQNALELARLYKTKLQVDPDNPIVLRGIRDLRMWYRTSLHQALRDKQPRKARQLLSMMRKSFPALAVRPQFRDLDKQIDRIAQFNAHLQKAQVYLAANALIKPAGANALEELKAARKLDPQDPKLQPGMARIADHFFRQAQQLRKAGNDTEAFVMVTTGLTEFADYGPLLALHDEMMGEIQNRRHSRRLLQRARQLLEDGQLIRPKGDNAYDIYNAVLREEPNNAEAKDGLSEIEQRLLAKVEAAYSQNKLMKARETVHRARQLFPNSQSLRASESRVNKAFDETVPQVNRIQFSARPMQTLNGQNELARIAPGSPLYIGFQYKNFYEAATRLEAKLTDRQGRILDQRPVSVDGTSGVHFFSINLPNPPSPGGDYGVELEMNGVRLIKANLSGLH